MSELKLIGEGNTPWLAVTISKRNEEPTTFFRYYSQTTEIIEAVGDLECQAYLQFHAVGVLQENKDELVGLLQYHTNDSMIDAHVCYMSVLKCCVANSRHPGYATAKVHREVSKKIIDPKLSRLDFFTGSSFNPFQEELIRERAYDVQNANCKSLSKVYECTNTDWPVVWSEEAELWMEGKENLKVPAGLQGRITEKLYRIFKDGADAGQDISDIIKLCLNLKSLNFANVLSCIVMHELSSTPVVKKINALSKFAHSDYFDVEFLESLTGNVADRYAALISSSGNGGKSSPTRQSAETGLAGEEQNCDDNIEDMLVSSLKNNYKFGNYDAVIREGLVRLSGLKLRERRLAARLISASYIKIENHVDLIEFVASMGGRDSGSRHLLPLKECIDFLSKDVCRALAKRVSVPIILSLYSRYYDDSLDKKLSYAYEDFLIANGIDRPTQLASIIGRHEKELIIYYLRYICIPRIMKISSEFTGSVEVQNERLAICSFLLELDAINSKVYESEIREITRTQAIRRGVRHVEQSKMSIDLVALKKLADKKIKEGFLRYRAMIKAGITPSDELGKAYLRFLAEGQPLPSDLLKVPTDEAGTLLREMVGSILADATINPMHGLDCYLSMRIRHGALSGQLRGPLELENIITKRKGDDESYASNEIWMSQLSH